MNKVMVRRSAVRKEYGTWCRIKSRCYNPNFPNYEYYGGRGVRMCDAWINSFDAFFAHVGSAPSPAHTIERVKNSRGYEPGNVKWATAKEQANNRSSNVLVTFRGRTMNVMQWAEHLGWPWSVIRNRLKRGWTVRRSLTSQPQPYRRSRR